MPYARRNTPLGPADVGESARILQQHPDRVRDRERIIAAHLQQQVSVGELRSQPVHPERGQRCEPRRSGAACARDETRAESERDGQARGRQGELGLRVGQRRLALGESRRIIGEDAHQPDERFPVDTVDQIESDEHSVRLSCGVDPRLVHSEERHRLIAVHRYDDRRVLGVRTVQGEVHSHGRHRADTGDSPSEEELPPRRCGTGGAGALIGRRHQ